MEILIREPKDIIEEHFNQIIDLIVYGGQIKRYGLTKRILSADLVAYKLQGNKVICTATIKNPYTSYKEKVFSSAKVENSISYDKELGYIVTHSEFENKGHCKDLLSNFFPFIIQNSIYATTRKPSMIHILTKNGFTKVGIAYNKDLSLLIYNGKK